MGNAILTANGLCHNVSFGGSMTSGRLTKWPIAGFGALVDGIRVRNKNLAL
jgi:hypothetical protein